MKVLEKGHTYALHSLDGGEQQILRFVKREGEMYPGNFGAHPGTTIQEVCRALIERLGYVDGQIHDNRNITAMSYLRIVIWLLEDRAAERHHRKLRGLSDNIETVPICHECGHIQCEGHK